MLKRNNVSFNFRSIPYLIVPDNQGEIFFSLAISTFILTKETINAARELVFAITEIIAATTPDIGVTGPTVQTGDIINMAVDIDNGKCFWGKNNTYFNYIYCYYFNAFV